MKALVFVLLCVSGAGYAQRIAVSVVEDSRTTGDDYYGNRCKVLLKISGDEARKYGFAKLLQVDKAVDDQGNDLLLEEQSGWEVEYKEKEENSFFVPVELYSPARKAETMDLAGAVRVFGPTEANGGLVWAKGISAKAGKNLLPADAPVAVTYMNKEEVLKYRKESEAKTEEGLSKLPQDMAEGLRDLLSYFSDAYSSGSDDNAIYFLITGDSSKLVYMQFVDDAGQPVEHSGYSKTGYMIVYYLTEPMTGSLGLKLSVETPEAVKDVPFDLKGVVLP